MRAVGARRGEERSLRGAIIPADRVQSITPRVAFRQTRCVKNTPLMNLLTQKVSVFAGAFTCLISKEHLTMMGTGKRRCIGKQQVYKHCSLNVRIPNSIRT